MAGNVTGSSAIGKPIRRTEDARLRRGKGRFLADPASPDLRHATFVRRSTHVHARILRIDCDAAREIVGVAANETRDVLATTEPFGDALNAWTNVQRFAPGVPISPGSRASAFWLSTSIRAAGSAI